MTEIIKPFGYESYFDLYRQLVDGGLAGEKAITITRPKPVQQVNRKTKATRTIEIPEEITLELEHIKARAFEEIYDRYINQPAPPAG